MDLKKALNERLTNYINEIDWENTFSDVKKTCVPVKDVVEYLNKLQKNSELDYKERVKFGKDVPYLHASTKLIKRDEKFTLAGIDYFINQITKPPKSILSQNTKIGESGKANEFVFNTGIPAIKGLVYDLEAKKFYYVNTCPGAGSCMTMCYGLHGYYVMYNNTYDSLTRRLNYLLNFPDKYEEQLYNELVVMAKEVRALKGSVNTLILRWNDSGDFFTKKYVEIAKRVIQNLQKNGYNVSSYGYTKMADVAKANNFDLPTTFSLGANPSQTEKIDLSKQKTSIVIPRELFKGLNPIMVDDLEKMKDRIVSDTKIRQQDPTIDRKNIITYYELMEKPSGKTPYWHVIVTKGSGDDAAIRKDVKSVLLLQH